MSKKDNSSQIKEYNMRLNIIQDYIERNIENNFTLEELSKISGFSKYHFHRIFSSTMNETINRYINRQKLEKSASFLIHTPNKSITEIAYDFGFGDSAIFSRSFKSYYGISPSNYRKEYSKNGKGIKLSYSYNDDKNLRRDTKMKNVNVEVTNVSEMKVVYLRHVGSYQNFATVFSSMLEKLFVFADKKGLVGNKDCKLICIYHDNPKITESDKRRTSVCLSVPEEIEANEDFCEMTISGGKYAIGHFEITTGEEHRDAWQYLYGKWLPKSGYQPDDRLSFEVYLNDPKFDPDGKQYIDIYLPIKPL